MRAILSKTTTDMMKSKIKSPQISELVFEVYITPKEFAEIVEEYDEKEFDLTISTSQK